jgi:hypothetical protein
MRRNNQDTDSHQYYDKTQGRENQEARQKEDREETGKRKDIRHKK